MLNRCSRIYSIILGLKALNPPKPPRLDEDLNSIQARLEIVEWGWLLLNALKADEDPQVVQQTAGTGAIIVSDRTLFPNDIQITEASYPYWVRGAAYTVVSEVENVRQAFARILIRQIGKEANRADGWAKLCDILSRAVFDFTDTSYPQVKWWKVQAEKMLKDPTDLAEMARLRGVLHHGAIDRGLPIARPRVLLNKAAATGRDEPEGPITYIDARLTELEQFAIEYAGWVQQHGFIPQLIP